MKKDVIINKQQSVILDHIGNDDFLTEIFYFSGGTALSEIYLQHRQSVDLDFFTPENYDPQSIISRLNGWSKKLNFTIKNEFIDPTHIYFLTFQDGSNLKIDFAKYPYKQLENTSQYRNKLRADSLRDIAANKLVTLTQRAEIKDFVDIYFLLQQFSFWDLRDDVRLKFKIEIDPYSFAGDCMMVEEFDFLPKMIKPLEIGKLKDFFTSLAKKLGSQSVK